jgi:myo-inositol-1(or 4)-monophosphatase
MRRVSELGERAVTLTAALEEELLAVALRAAESGGAELLARFRRPLEIQTKSTPTDPVSEADLASERAIRAVLGEARPDDGILGEEGGETYGQGGSADGVLPDGGLRWIVDPLDGTVNYLYGIARFCVSIACEGADGTLVGVVLDPISGERFVATRSGHALRFAGPDAEGEELHGSDCETLARALVATGFSYDGDVRAVQGRIVTRLLGQVRDIRRAGAAALDLAACAAGQADAYFERTVKIWDVAAGMLICQRAGLVVRELPVVPAGDGDPELGYGVTAAPAAFADELFGLVAGKI